MVIFDLKVFVEFKIKQMSSFGFLRWLLRRKKPNMLFVRLAFSLWHTTSNLKNKYTPLTQKQPE